MNQFRTVITKSRGSLEESAKAVLRRIEMRAQPLYTEHLGIFHYAPCSPFHLPGDHPHFWLGAYTIKAFCFLSWRTRPRPLVSLWPALYGSAFGERTIHASLHDARIATIAREELGLHAVEMQATDLAIQEDY